MFLCLHYLLFLLFIVTFIDVRCKKNLRDTEKSGVKAVDPYHVVIVSRADSVNHLLCEGVIVSNKAVLTRAQCTVLLVEKPTEDKECFVVAGFQLKLSEMRKIEFFCYNSKRYGQHEPKSVALVFTEMSFHLNEFVDSISLSDQVPAIGTQCYACALKTNINNKIVGAIKTDIKVVKCEVEDSEIICTEPVEVSMISNPLICSGNLVGLATNTESSKIKTHKYVAVSKNVDWIRNNKDNTFNFPDSKCSNDGTRYFGLVIAGSIVFFLLSSCCLVCCCVICIIAVLTNKPNIFPI